MWQGKHNTALGTRRPSSANSGILSFHGAVSPSPARSLLPSRSASTCGARCSNSRGELLLHTGFNPLFTPGRMTFKGSLQFPHGLQPGLDLFPTLDQEGRHPLGGDHRPEAALPSSRPPAATGRSPRSPPRRAPCLGSTLPRLLGACGGESPQSAEHQTGQNRIFCRVFGRRSAPLAQGLLS